jgi:hypothetical protein
MTDDTPLDAKGIPEAAVIGGGHRSERPHRRDYVAVAISGAALLASAVAAAFSGWQAWVASDTGERQLRAYLELTDIEVVCPGCTTPPGRSASCRPIPSRNFVHIRFENSGQTPAREIRYKINWWVIPSKNAPLPAKFDFPDYSPTSAALVSTSELARDKHRDGCGSIEHDIDQFRS